MSPGRRTTAGPDPATTLPDSQWGDAVWRADQRRAQQAAFGWRPDADASRLANGIARAMTDGAQSAAEGSDTRGGDGGPDDAVSAERTSTAPPSAPVPTPDADAHRDARSVVRVGDESDPAPAETVLASRRVPRPYSSLTPGTLRAAAAVRDPSETGAVDGPPAAGASAVVRNTGFGTPFPGDHGEDGARGPADGGPVGSRRGGADPQRDQPDRHDRRHRDERLDAIGGAGARARNADGSDHGRDAANGSHHGRDAAYGSDHGRGAASVSDHGRGADDRYGDGGGRAGEAGRRAAGQAQGSDVLPALRDAVFGSRTGAALLDAASLPLPTVPAAVCDDDGLVVRANTALVQLVGDEAALLGAPLSRLVVGADADAQLIRPNGDPVRIRLVRWEPTGGPLSVVLFVELGEASTDMSGQERAADRVWTLELERIARVGTWSFELADSTLHRSETLGELYGTVGLDGDTGGPERRQVEALVAGLRAGGAVPGQHVDLQLPGGASLSCRAEVEYGVDGRPERIVGVVRDLSVQRHATERLRRAGQRFADLMALLPAGVAVFDAGGRLVDANPGLCALLDVPVERLLGTTAPMMAAEVPASGAWPGWLRIVPPGARYGYHVGGAPLRRGDGTTVWCELDVAITLADDGSRFWLVVATDVSDRRRAAELLRSAGTVDELTRLPNRAACLSLLDGLLAGPGRDRLAVVCGDLDDFQRVNSALGHDAGDELLVTLAARLQRDLPFGCSAARLSGDEFVVVCADHGEVGGPDQLARIVSDLLRTTVTVHGSPVTVTGSVGLATPVPSGDLCAADLLRFAEVAMHDAKTRQGRGGISVATDRVVASATRALEREAELRAAISGTGLVCEYQPVVGPDGTVLSFEALVRWAHPTRGLIPPGDFLPVAQRSGLMRDLDLWVLRTATAEAATWVGPDGPGGRSPAVAVNLAGLLPGDAEFELAVSDAVVAAGLDWDRLVLELVETSLISLPPHALAAMKRLTARGVRFAVDDFGTGYSSLARLKELPAQTIKVDRAFVTGVAEDPVDFAVARAVVDMARAMGRTTVAEGVETAEQFHALRRIGVDAYQGWLFSRPVPPAQVPPLLLGGRLQAPATAGRADLR